MFPPSKASQKANMHANGLIIEVDRVSSVEEAVAFRDAGATLIGVALSPDPRFEDDRFVSLEVAKAIEKAIAPAQLVGIVPNYFYDEGTEGRARIERVLTLKPSFVHVYRGGLHDEFIPAFRAAGISVIQDGAVLDSSHGAFIDPNDPASWVRKQAGDPAREAVFHHLDVLSDLADDPWVVLNGLALDWPEEIPQVADITACCRDLPLLLSLMEVGADTISAYTRAFPDARGFFARLGPGETSGAPNSRPEPLLAALRALQAFQ